MRLATLLVLPLVLGILPGPADCADDPGNVLLEAGFDKDVKGWTASPGAQVSHEPGQGHPKPGALKGVADLQGSLTIVGPCVKVRPSTPYRFGAHMRTLKGIAFFCSLNVFQFSDQTCSDGQDPLGSAARPPEEKWQAETNSATTGAQAGSVQPHAVCSGQPGFAVLWDSITIDK